MRWLLLTIVCAFGCEQAPAPAPAPSTSASAPPSPWIGPDRPGPWGDIDVSCMFNDFGHGKCLVCAVRETSSPSDQERVLCWVVKP